MDDSCGFKVKVRASVVFEGTHTPLSAELIIETRPSERKLVADKDELKLLLDNAGKSGKLVNSSESGSDCEEEIKKLQQELSRLKLKEVEQQQSDFE